MIPKWLSWFRSLIYGETTGGNHYPVQVDSNGQLQVTIADYLGTIERNNDATRTYSDTITSYDPNNPTFLPILTSSTNPKEIFVVHGGEIASITFRFNYGSTSNLFEKLLLLSTPLVDNFLIPYPGCDATEINDISAISDISHFFKIEVGFSKVVGSADIPLTIRYTTPNYRID
jgi:hypothetical protein